MQRGNNLFIISIKKDSVIILGDLTHLCYLVEVESYFFIVFFRVMSKIRNE